jgi:hypothetical protein
MRQRISVREHFRRGNAEGASIRMRIDDRNELMMSGLIVFGKSLFTVD